MSRTVERPDQLRSVHRPRVEPGERFCMRCHQPRPVQGGRQEVFNGGLNQRWTCAKHWLPEAA